MSAPKKKARFKKGTNDADSNGKKGGSLKAEREPADQVLFDLGRHARVGGIPRDGCPKIGKDADIWLEGWDYQDAV